MEANRELSCPQCDNPFEQRTVQGVVIDYCMTCGGVWLDPGELEELTGYKRGMRSGTPVGHDDDDDHHVESGSAEVEAQEEDDDSDGILGFVTDALSGSKHEDVDEWDEEWDGGWDGGDGGDGGGGWGGGGDGGGGGGGE